MTSHNMRLSLAVQTPESPSPVPVALLSGSFPQKVEKARQIGAQGIELMPFDPQALDVAEIRRLVESAQLQVSAIGSGAVPFLGGLTLLNSDPEKARLARQRLKELVQFAHLVGAPLVTIGSFRGRLAGAGIQGEAQLAAILGEAADHAQELQVRLALEPLNHYETDIVQNAGQGLDFIQRVGHPCLGLLLDTYHVNIEECSWTVPFKQALQAGCLFHIHLSDNNRLAPGFGLIDFSCIVQALYENGYQGFLSAELFPQPDADTAARQTIRHMQALLENLPCN